MGTTGKPLVWLRGQIKTPPFTPEARLEAGGLLRRLQMGESLGMPHARAMASIGARCYDWRIMYRIDSDAIVILEVFAKSSRQTPDRIIQDCRRRLSMYNESE